jgi:hypothetical protein
MTMTFKFDPDTGILSDGRGPILRMEASFGGHIVDTGALIAKLLTWHLEACADTGMPFFGPLQEAN